MQQGTLHTSRDCVYVIPLTFLRLLFFSFACWRSGGAAAFCLEHVFLSKHAT